MTVVSAFMGNGTELIPSGYAKLYLQVQTNTGTDLQTTFTVTGISSITTDEFGYYEVLVPIPSNGTVTVSASLKSGYSGILIQALNVESGKSYLVLFEFLKGAEDVSTGGNNVPKSSAVVSYCDQFLKKSNTGDIPVTTSGRAVGQYAFMGENSPLGVFSYPRVCNICAYSSNMDGAYALIWSQASPQTKQLVDFALPAYGHNVFLHFIVPTSYLFAVISGNPYVDRPSIAPVPADGMMFVKAVDVIANAHNIE